MEDISVEKANDVLAVGKYSKVVCTALCWDKKIALTAAAWTANKIRLIFQKTFGRRRSFICEGVSGMVETLSNLEDIEENDVSDNAI